MDVFSSQYEKMNVFVKPNEQCRACSNMVMARKERLAPSTDDEEKVKRTFLCLLCSYVKKDIFRSTLNLLSEPPTYVLVSKRTYLGHNTKCWTITPFTYPLVYPSTRQLAKTCQLFSKDFNTMSTLFIHQPPTSSQKIDSREGLFWCKKGLGCECGEMNIYLERPPFAPHLGLFAAKCTTIWCKTQCNMPLNAVRFGAKCSAFWC